MATMFLALLLLPYWRHPEPRRFIKKNCTAVADKRKLVTSIFYVRSHSVASNDGIPTLMRADFDLSGGAVKMQSAQPIIEGVQSIQFEYGRDTDEDGSADIFDDCAFCTAADWANVVAVQIHVLARNLEASSGYAEDKTCRICSTGCSVPDNQHIGV